MNHESLTPVVVPPVGAAGLPLRLSAWFFEPGDQVDAGDRLFEVLLSGITCDVEAPCAGRLVRVIRQLDEPIAEGEVVAWIEPFPAIHAESAQ